MAESTPVERALLDVYRAADRALADVGTRGLQRALDGTSSTEGARRLHADRAVRRATKRVVAQLNELAPDLLQRMVDEAGEVGVDEAARALQATTGQRTRARKDRGGSNSAALDRVAATLLARAAEAHTAILRTTPDRYRTAIAKAIPANLAGVDVRRDVAQRAWWDLNAQGITAFVDRSGRTWRLSSYVEMAARTAQARAKIDAKHDELVAAGHDLVIINGSGDRCERCRPWHGRILTLTGAPGPRQVPHPTRRGDTVTVDVVGTVAMARAAGWGHPNCRCGTDLYIPGITRIPPDVEREDNGQYAARQRQRALERQIRGWKEREQTALDKPAKAQARAGVKAAQTRMREHLDANPDLLRRTYRESIGAGNIPDAKAAARFAADTTEREGYEPRRADEAVDLDAAVVAQRRAVPLSRMSDAALDAAMSDAILAEDMDELDAVSAEVDRRDDRRNTRRDARTAAREERDRLQGEHFDRLLAEGVDEEQAVEDAFGVTVATQRRQAAIRALRDEGFKGRSFDELSSASHKARANSAYWQAEQDTRGVLLSRAGEAAGVDALSLFVGSEARVRKWASDELREWFDRNGRPTLAEWRAELMQDGQVARSMRAGRGDFLQ